MGSAAILAILTIVSAALLRVALRPRESQRLRRVLPSTLQQRVCLSLFVLGSLPAIAIVAINNHKLPALAVLGAAALIAVLLTAAMIHSTVKPLARLANDVAEFRDDGSAGQLTQLATDTTEFAAIHRQVNRAGWRARASRREIENTLRHSNMLRDQLAKIVAQREGEIRKRTVELANANAELERLSNTDALTRVANRRSFDAELETAWRAARRDNKSLALLMIDVDHFKQYNDLFGHQGGDLCLAKVAAAIRAALHRPRDFLARYGGEEFAIILPDTDAEGARKVAEHIRYAVEELRMPTGKPDSPTLTVSIGMAVASPAADECLADLVGAADTALYLAKSQGRNCVRERRAA